MYLKYLTKLGIGMTVWTLGPDPGDAAYDYINANGDDTTFTTANNYDGWTHGCIQPASAVHKGAGRLIMNWFAQEAEANEKALERSAPRAGDVSIQGYEAVVGRDDMPAG